MKTHMFNLEINIVVAQYIQFMTITWELILRQWLFFLPLTVSALVCKHMHKYTFFFAFFFLNCIPKGNLKLCFAHFNKSLDLFSTFLRKYNEMRGSSRLRQVIKVKL